MEMASKLHFKHLLSTTASYWNDLKFDLH